MKWWCEFEARWIIWGFVGNLYNVHLLIWGAGREEIAEWWETRLHGCKLVQEWQWGELAGCWLFVVCVPALKNYFYIQNVLLSDFLHKARIALSGWTSLVSMHQLLVSSFFFFFFGYWLHQMEVSHFSIPYKTCFLVTYSIICPFISTKLKVCC